MVFHITAIVLIGIRRIIMFRQTFNTKLPKSLKILSLKLYSKLIEFLSHITQNFLTHDTRKKAIHQ